MVWLAHQRAMFLGRELTMRLSSKARLTMLAGLVAFSSSACAIPVGNFGLPLVQGCSIYVLEAAQGTLAVDLIPGVAGVGCNVGL